jgi:hypothetical protein
VATVVMLGPALVVTGTWEADIEPLSNSRK